MSEDPIRLIQEENRQTQAFFDSLNAGIQRSVQNQFEVQRSALGAARTVAGIAGNVQQLRFNAQNARAKIALDGERLRQSNRELLLREKMAPHELDIARTNAQSSRMRAAAAQQQAELQSEVLNMKAREELAQAHLMKFLPEYEKNLSPSLLSDLSALKANFMSDKSEDAETRFIDSANQLFGQVGSSQYATTGQFTSSSAAQASELWGEAAGNALNATFSESARRLGRFELAGRIFGDPARLQEFIAKSPTTPQEEQLRSRYLQSAEEIQSEEASSTATLTELLGISPESDIIRHGVFPRDFNLADQVVRGTSFSGFNLEEKRDLINGAMRGLETARVNKVKLQQAIRAGIDPASVITQPAPLNIPSANPASFLPGPSATRQGDARNLLDQGVPPVVTGGGTDIESPERTVVNPEFGDFSDAEGIRVAKFDLINALERDDIPPEITDAINASFTDEEDVQRTDIPFLRRIVSEFHDNEVKGQGPVTSRETKEVLGRIERSLDSRSLDELIAITELPSVRVYFQEGSGQFIDDEKTVTRSVRLGGQGQYTNTTPKEYLDEAKRLARNNRPREEVWRLYKKAIASAITSQLADNLKRQVRSKRRGRK